ncbi:hypothetical protein [Paraburkholderia kururiensis]|uniref:hypothetical protein n=1 Tax=Paraburkholderia kururiensis TaxID=984307 RepID=UPI0005A8CC52|nr:hypothetical protein [Paraburkholderia kururiensis]
MLRWLIAILLLANLLALAAISGAFGPTPASGPREPGHLNREVHPDWLKVRPISPAESADATIVGGPVPMPAVKSSELAQ